MAGDWIKMRMNLRTHPKVVRIASALNADRFRVIGALHAVWCLADEHTEDGDLPGYSLGALDDSIGWPGFAAAMADVEWLTATAKGLLLPRFYEHNGASAKRRAMEAERKRRDREASAGDADKKRTREREREEVKKEQAPRPSGSAAQPSGGKAKAPAGSRIDPGMALPDEWRDFCIAERPDLDPAGTFAKFRDHWTAKAGKDARKVEWFATWRNWVRGEKRAPGAPVNGSARAAAPCARCRNPLTGPWVMKNEGRVCDSCDKKADAPPIAQRDLAGLVEGVAKGLTT